MNNLEKHSGGCACGKVRYHSIGKPVRTGLCHCRYCQLRTGTAFGISVYFKKMNTILIWILALIALGLFIYFVPYKNIKLVQKKLDTIIEMLNKKDNQ